MKIRMMNESDLAAASLVHKAAFPRQGFSSEWLVCNLKAYPRFLSFVAEKDNQIVGYIVWAQKSGFRAEAVLELEQLAVSPAHQGLGIGRSLIEQSVPLVKDELAKKNSKLKHIMVTTRADNHAQQLYKSTLGAEVEATISNLYSADEVLMIARNV